MVRIYTLSRDTGEEGTSQAQGSFLGSEGFQAHIGHPSPGIQHQEDKPLSWFETQWGLPKGCKKLGLCS